MDDEIILGDAQPTSCTVGPSGRRRRAGISFTTAANLENVVVGYTAGTVITYTFVAALGAPGANNVHVKVQASVDLSVRKLAQALQGVVDAANITYGAGVGAHPDVDAYYTGNRFSIANVVPLVHLPATPGIMFFEKVQDRTTTAWPFTLTSTTTRVLTPFTRTYAHRYTMTGNAAGPPADCVAGPYQTFMPIGFTRDFSGNLVWYRLSYFVVEAVSSNTMIIETDVYFSLDEVTYTMIGRGINLSRDTVTQGSQEYGVRLTRIPPGAGLYVTMRSNVAAVNEWVDVKVQRGTFPVGV
jgi:hypothetical protein